VGLVTLAVPAPLHTALAGNFPEATWILLPHEMGVITSSAVEVLINNMARATAILIGPGLGQEETTREFMVKLLTEKAAYLSTTRHIGFIQRENKGVDTAGKNGKVLPPLVVDADGLILLTKIEGWQGILPDASVLTPHPGEMAALTGQAVDVIQKDRLAVAKKYAIEWGHVVVLKGAFTVIASPDGQTTTIPIASSALAHAGTGDVLSGIIVGLLAQGVTPYKAAVAGCWIHAQAGMTAAEILGSSAAVQAGDVLDCIADILSELQ
jgi:NAD(P)H-hydrate epimerase